MRWVKEPMSFRRTGRTTRALGRLEEIAARTGKEAVYVAGTRQHAKSMPATRDVRIISFADDPDSMRGLEISAWDIDHSVAPTTERENQLLDVLRSLVK